MVNINVQTENVTDDDAELLRRNIIFFCRTPRGSLPQMRDFGIDYSCLDEPFHIFRMKATVDIVTGVRKYYGVSVSTIDIRQNDDGNIQIAINI